MLSFYVPKGPYFSKYPEYLTGKRIRIDLLLPLNVKKKENCEWKNYSTGKARDLTNKYVYKQNPKSKPKPKRIED